MTGGRSTHGLAAVVIALLVIVGTIGAYSYFEYTGVASDNKVVNQELADANSKYSSLASRYNDLISSYNESLSLLSRSVAVMNTSEPAYVQASKELSALWQIYLTSKPAQANLLTDDVLIDFGNGSRIWFNQTAFQPGWNLYVQTVVITKGNVSALWFPEYGSHLVGAIEGGRSIGNHYWFVWTYTAGAWALSNVGADNLAVSNGSVFAWTLCGVDSSFNPTCRP
jgi:hypothetical protein